MKFTRLSHQILFFFVTIVILTLSISGWATTTLAQRTIVNNITWQHQVLAHRIAEEIKLRREDIRPILSNLTDADNVRSMNPVNVAVELQRYQTRFSTITSIYVADQTGQQIARTDGQPLENVATTLGFQIAQEGRELISDVYLSQGEREPMMTVYEPITDNNKVVGILVADVNFAWVQTILESLALIHNETAVVFAQNGRIVAHSRMAELAELPTLTDPLLIEALIQSPAGVLEDYIDELGRTVVGSHAPVSDLGWGVVIQSPMEELAAEVNVLRRTIGLGLLGSVALAVIAGWLMARHLAQPINRLMQIAEQVEAGNLSARSVQPYGPGELGQLARAFDRMTGALQRRKVETEQATHALQESEASLLKAQQIAHLGNWDWNITTGDLAWSDEIYRIFGLTPQEFGATYEAFLQSVHPDDREHVRQSVNRAVYEGEPYDIEHRVVRPDGTVRTVNEVGEVTYDQDGNPVHMVGTVLDITERKHAEEALHHYAERLKTLRVIDQAILTAQSPEAIAQAALHHIRQLIPCQQASLATIDLEIQEATVLGVHVNGETELETGIRFPLETLGNLQDLQQGRVLTVDDISSSSQPSLVQPTLYAEGTRSYIIVPLTAQGNLIGTLNLGSEEPAAFTPEHIDFAREVADQLAIAIQQARLHEQVQRHAAEMEQRVIHATAEIRQRADELAVLYDVSRDMMTTLDLDTLLPTIAERVTDTLRADRCTVFLFNEEFELLQARAAYGYMAERMANFSYRPGEEVVGQAHTTGKTQYMPDLDDAPGLPRRDAICAVLAAPLVSATAGSLGVLSVASLQPRAFTQNQQRLLETMASQITGAIENARLYRAAERHSMELAALYEVGKEITATLELDSMLQTIADVAIRLVGADKSLILLVDTERERLTKIVGCGYSPAQLDGHTFREFQDGISGWVLREKASTLSVNIQTDERNRGKARISAQQSNDKSAAVAPLSIGDQVIGTLTVVNSQRTGVFTLADLNLITMLAGQATIAIQNAQLYEAAQEADRLKSAFLATMSHELRTPLNSIIGFTGIILQGLTGPLTDEQTKQLKMVQGSARHLLNLINDVLDISKIEAGQLEIASEPFDMKAAVEKAVQTVTPLAEKKGLAITSEVAPEVGQITSDQRRVEQILINLLNNAIKFTEEGEARVTCQVSDDQIVTHVTDTGIGIKPEDMDKLFNPFQQVETGLTRRHEGTGLGLSISKKLVEMLGGEIWVESQWGAGSTFAFSLPTEREKDETQDTSHRGQ